MSAGGEITCARRAGRSSFRGCSPIPVFIGRGVPRGDGRPVILMPGFGGGDQTLSCSRRGFGGSDTGRTLRVRHKHRVLDRAVDRVERRLEGIHNSTDAAWR